MAEHTPGPWTIHRGGGHARPSIRGAEVIHTNGRLRNELGISSASFSEEVCQFHADLDLPGPQANASLIAAAPDLLAVAGEMYEELGGTDGMPADAAYARWYHTIAKAKGTE